MRASGIQLANLGLVLLLWAVVIAVVFFAVRGIIRYVRRSREREEREREMLDLMREQNRRNE